MLWEAFIFTKGMSFNSILHKEKSNYSIYFNGDEIQLPHSLLKYFSIPSLCLSPQYDEIYCTVSTFNAMLNRFDGNLSKFNSDSITGLLTKGMPISQIENSVNQLLIE